MNYYAQAIEELDALSATYASKIEHLEDECIQLRSDLEKIRLGYMTVLAKLEHQEGIIAQLQLELSSYRNAQKQLAEPLSTMSVKESVNAPYSIRKSPSP